MVSRAGGVAALRAWLALSVLLVRCALGATPSPALGLHPEFGISFRPLFGWGDLNDMASPASGFDIDLHVVNEAGGPGVRAVLGSNSLSREQVQTSGSLFGVNLDGSYTTRQEIGWWALGPSWSIPQRNARSEVYVLAGMGSATASGSGMLVNTGGSEPASASTLALLVGALMKRGLSQEAASGGRTTSASPCRARSAHADTPSQ